MQVHSRTESQRMRAIEALKSVLTHVSGVKFKYIDTESLEIDRDNDIIAQIEVYGRARTLACMLVPNDEPLLLRESVMCFCDRAIKGANHATPVLIAPRLSTDLQKLCRENSAGMLDLEGNARLELGEMFIACQQVSRPEAYRKAPREHTVKGAAHAGAAA